MKISGYKVAQASATTAGAGNHMRRGLFGLDITGAVVNRGWEDIFIRKITNVARLTDVDTAIRSNYDITFATAPSATGNENFTITISYEDSRQRINKPFKYTTTAGQSITNLAVAFKTAINLSAVPFTASNVAGVLTIVADEAGVGYDPVYTAGTDSLTTTVVVQSAAAATNDLVKTDRDYWASRFGNVLASDFTSSEGYGALIFEYIDTEESEPKGKSVTKFAALFYNNSIAGILSDVNGNLLANPSV